MSESKKNGFTLPELLVVMAIMALVGVASVTSFSRISETSDRENLDATVQNTIAKLDRSIGQGAIHSYRLIFSSGSSGMIAVKNFYAEKNAVSVEFDFTASTGTLRSESLLLKSWAVDEYRDGRLESRLYRPTANGSSFPLDFSDTEYGMLEFDSSIDAQSTNSILLVAFGRGKMGEVVFRWDTESDETIVLENVFGKKTLIGYRGSVVNPRPKTELLFDSQKGDIRLSFTP